MKKTTIVLAYLAILIFLLLASYLTIKTLKIDNPKQDIYSIKSEKIVKISKGISNDIIFSGNHGDHYYINRGLSRGLNLDSLQAKVLNKTVTLHLPKVLGGIATSEHIAQIAVGNDIIFSEFK